MEVIQELGLVRDMPNDEYHKVLPSEVAFYSSSQFKDALEDIEYFHKKYVTKEVNETISSSTQSNFDMLASGVAAGMEDAGYAVSSLHSERNFATKGIEGDSKIDQVSDAVRGLVDQDTHCLRVTQTSTSGYGILKVKL